MSDDKPEDFLDWEQIEDEGQHGDAVWIFEDEIEWDAFLAEITDGHARLRAEAARHGWRLLLDMPQGVYVERPDEDWARLVGIGWYCLSGYGGPEVYTRFTCGRPLGADDRDRAIANLIELRRNIGDEFSAQELDELTLLIWFLENEGKAAG